MGNSMTLAAMQATSADLAARLREAQKAESAAMTAEAIEGLDAATTALSKFETLRARAESHLFEAEHGRLVAECTAAQAARIEASAVLVERQHDAKIAENNPDIRSGDVLVAANAQNAANSARAVLAQARQINDAAASRFGRAHQMEEAFLQKNASIAQRLGVAA